MGSNSEEGTEKKILKFEPSRACRAHFFGSGFGSNLRFVVDGFFCKLVEFACLLFFLESLCCQGVLWMLSNNECMIFLDSLESPLLQNMVLGLVRVDLNRPKNVSHNEFRDVFWSNSTQKKVESNSLRLHSVVKEQDKVTRIFEKKYWKWDQPVWLFANPVFVLVKQKQVRNAVETWSA